MKKAILGFLKIVLPLLLGIYLIWVFFHNMSENDITQFKQTLHKIDYFIIFIALVIGFIAYVSRAYRWKYTLEPLGYQTKFWNRYHAILIGYIVNLTIPRAGEASRSAMLFRSDGVPFSKSFGTIIGERAVDLAVLMGITFATAYLAGPDFIELKNQIQANFSGKSKENVDLIGQIIKYSILGVLLLFAVLFIFKQTIRAKIIGFVKDILNGLLAIFKTKNPFLYILHTVIIWSCYLLMAALPFYALPETADIPLKGILLSFLAGTVGIIFTNGGIGVFPLLVGTVVAYYLHPTYPDTALAIGNAIGLITWASQTILMIVLGLISLILLPKNYTAENESN